ncbi:tRNA(Ile)-lysidine synthase TilS/MesJ [Anaerosphaera aminiphila DSM 21120]|uniref:tRNA(Ile)-lysidine synthase TilS/MesJ n=1 Tax=Anaerosphaera aminiphila DSM 21120 TaxID=1120995 RepID=A0A1M5Q5M9_9FIRM|nr:tRNA(Ile)-lysidine synthase TilS/MesJ [Anaerosphaera aminiphila DSM 21120]
MEDQIKEKPIGDIERSIIKTYRKNIWVKFIRAINEFEMIADGDKIAIAISGGKDSLTLAKLFQELQKHGKMNFELEFIAMDPGFKEENRKLLEYNCNYLNIPVKIHNSDIFEVANRVAGDSPCYMCARMRRGNLYAKAQELGCNKLALGHHFNDVVETIMLNVLFAGNFKTMMPKLHSDNFKGLELIRPMYYIEEEAIIRFMKSTGLNALDCACTIAEKKEGNMRFYVKDLIKEIKGVHENADINILRSAENINMGAIVGWKTRDEKHSFLENYNQEEQNKV